jgi:DNA-binding transcriptional LysR family regulator
MAHPPLDSVDLRLLRVFLAVVESGGFAPAAARLDLSLSTVSSHVKSLEARLDLRLCRRGRAGFALTEPGETVAAEARRLLAAADGFAARAAGLRNRLAGPVHVGMLDATLGDPRARMPEALTAFAAAAPDAEIRLACHPPDALLRDVTAGALDVAVGSFPRVALGLEYLDLYAERQLFFCGRGHALFDAPDDAIDFEELRRHRLIGRRYWGARDLKGFASHRVGASVADMESEAALILSGAFLGYLPEHYARPWVEGGALRAIAPERFSYRAPFQMTWRADRAAEPRVGAMIGAIASAHGAPVPAPGRG